MFNQEHIKTYSIQFKILLDVEVQKFNKDIKNNNTWITRRRMNYYYYKSEIFHKALNGSAMLAWLSPASYSFVIVN